VSFINTDNMPQSEVDRLLDEGTSLNFGDDFVLDLNKRYSAEEYYNLYRFEHQGDIGKDMPILRMYAEECKYVTELGVRYGISTAALLAARPKRLISYDRDPCIPLRILKRIAEDNNVEFIFKQEDVLKTIIPMTELMFIDTKHTYKQLLAELTMHSGSVSKYIIMHDTVSCGERGEDGSTPGLNQAIYEFTSKNKMWNLELISRRHAGLTVLRNFDFTVTATPKDYSKYGG
jgi:predicted O-methyltransferase YrrM